MQRLHELASPYPEPASVPAAGNSSRRLRRIRSFGCGEDEVQDAAADRAPLDLGNGAVAVSAVPAPGAQRESSGLCSTSFSGTGTGTKEISYCQNAKIRDFLSAAITSRMTNDKIQRRPSSSRLPGRDYAAAQAALEGFYSIFTR